MQITRKSPHSGLTYVFDLPVTQEQYDAWQNGMLIQDAMPNLPSYWREYIMSGITPAEWDEMFPPEPDDEEDER